MKLSSAFAVLAAIASLAFSGCDNKEAEQAAAVEKFKTDIAGVAAAQPEKKGLIGRTIGTMTALAQLPARLKAIKADQLPTDLKQAFNDFVAKLSKVETVVAEFGATPQAAFQSIVSNPQQAQAFQQRLQALLPEIAPAGRKLLEVGKKYGIEKLADVVPQQ